MQRVPIRPVKCTVMYRNYVSLCVSCDLRIASSYAVLESGAARQGKFPWEEAVRASKNTQLLRLELISVDREHGTRNGPHRV